MLLYSLSCIITVSQHFAGKQTQVVLLIEKHGALGWAGAMEHGTRPPTTETCMGSLDGTTVLDEAHGYNWTRTAVRCMHTYVGVAQ